jgi:hypothetical protein
MHNETSHRQTLPACLRTSTLWHVAMSPAAAQFLTPDRQPEAVEDTTVVVVIYLTQTLTLGGI